MMNALLLLTLAVTPTPTKTELAALTQLLAGVAARSELVDVLTDDDLRRAADIEADRQLADCASESCLAELAAALDARVVLFGTVSPYGDELVIHLTAFDTSQARAIGRASKRIDELGRVAGTVERLGKRLVDEAIADQHATRDRPLRLLVMELTVAGQEAGAGAADIPDGANDDDGGLLLAGALTGIGGLLVVAGGLGIDLWGQQIFEATLENGALSTEQKNAAFDDADALGTVAIGLYVVGGAAVIVAGALAGVSLATAE